MLRGLGKEMLWLQCSLVSIHPGIAVLQQVTNELHQSRLIMLQISFLLSGLANKWRGPNSTEGAIKGICLDRKLLENSKLLIYADHYIDVI